MVTKGVMEKVVVGGDLADLSASDRLEFYGMVCKSLGLNPLTQPFEYLQLNGRLTLYAKKEAAEQLARIHGVSVELDEPRIEGGLYIIKARASTADRHVDATGVEPLPQNPPAARANAAMKAETKASRRAVLRLVGLGTITEIEDIPGAATVEVDHDTGEIVGKPKAVAPPAQVPTPEPEPTPRKPVKLADIVRRWQSMGNDAADLLEIAGVDPLGDEADQLAELKAWGERQGVGTWPGLLEAASKHV